VDPFTVDVIIERPRAEVFEYLADIANHAEFSDHYLVDWRLTREDSYGEGAGARFRARQPLNRFPWGDTTLTEVEPLRRIVERGRQGKYNRIRTLGIWELEDGPGGAGTTRVRFSFETLPKYPTDKVQELAGARPWRKRQAAKALRRLARILEEDRDRGQRVTLAGGGPRKPASAFRFRDGADR